MGLDLHICWAPEAKRSSASRAGVSVIGELQDAWPEGRLGPIPAWAIDRAKGADGGYLPINLGGVDYLSHVMASMGALDSTSVSSGIPLPDDVLWAMFGEQPTGTTVEEVEAGRGELIPARKLTHNDYQWISPKEVRGSLAMIAASQPARLEVDPEGTALFRIWMGYLKLAAAELGIRVG
jgi:hypothetical protein